MKCKWYAAFEGVCTNGECPYRGDVCPTSEHPEVCKYAEEKPEIPQLSVEELVKTLRLCNIISCRSCAFCKSSNCRSILMSQAADMLEKLAAEKDAKKPDEWSSVKDGPPKNEQEVLIYCNRGGFRFVCPAIYEDGTMLTQDSRWNWNDIEEYGTYSEENDDYFVPKGWWENRQFTPDDVYNCPVDCEVTHWMPLPEPPKEEKIHE
mgnify:CR=1 FL=1|jgi:hypothetical protein